MHVRVCILVHVHVCVCVHLHFMHVCTYLVANSLCERRGRWRVGGGVGGGWEEGKWRVGGGVSGGWEEG